MKRTNLILGASAFVLAIAGAFTTKAARTSHAVTYATKGGGSCVTHSKVNNRTSIQANGGAVAKISNRTQFLKGSSCATTLFTIADN